MKTITLSELLKMKPTPMFSGYKGKYSIYYCPESEDFPFKKGKNVKVLSSEVKIYVLENKIMALEDEKEELLKKIETT